MIWKANVTGFELMIQCMLAMMEKVMAMADLFHLEL